MLLKLLLFAPITSIVQSSSELLEVLLFCEYNLAYLLLFTTYVITFDQLVTVRAKHLTYAAIKLFKLLPLKRTTEQLFFPVAFFRNILCFPIKDEEGK